MPVAALADLLDFARRHVPFYAARLPAGPTGDPVGELAALPPLTRRDVRAHRARLVAAVGDTADWHLARSTGTTGEPVEVVRDGLAEVADLRALGRFADAVAGPGTAAGCDLIYLALHAGAASQTAPSAWSADGRATKWNLLRAWQRADPGFLASLTAVGGRVVTALPSTAELLAGRVLGLGAGGRVRPAAVLLSGEHLEPAVRYRVADAFGCPVAEMYATSEAGLVGTGCPTGDGFHAEPAVWVEIVDGEVVLTPLAGRAMPLLRYRTGDRAEWLPEPCGCGRDAPRFRLLAGRRPTRLVTAAGGTVNLVRFAKLLAGLDVRRAAVEPAGAGVRLRYDADRPLAPAARRLTEAAVCAALGPAAVVEFERTDTPGPPADAGRPDPPAERVVADVADWLRRELAGTPGLALAVLTGSAFDPEATTRFSDLDLVLLYDRPPEPLAAAALGRRLSRRVPGLAVVPDARAGLERRAPLLACRLLAEGLAVVGRADELTRPAVAAVRDEGRPVVQRAAAGLWSMLTADREPDALRDAWAASKAAIDALRFDHLAHGGTATAARPVVAAAAVEFAGSSWFGPLEELIAVTREHLPPPPAAVPRYLIAALECVRCVAARLG